MYQPIHTQISVTAEFIPGKKPHIQSFTWEDKEYKIEKLTLITQARHGREAVWFFHVTTKTMALKLRFDSATLQWWLEELSWEE